MSPVRLSPLTLTPCGARIRSRERRDIPIGGQVHLAFIRHSTPLNTTLFELIVALAPPSYTLSLAVIPEMIVTAAFAIFAVKPAGCVSE